MIALNRRKLILGGAAGVLIGARLTALRAEEEELAEDFSGPLPSTFLGTEAPLDSEERKAGEILGAAPDAGPPFRIADYFDKLADTHYKEGWPDRWNPVIVDFFKATNTRPRGDTTAWCAAFLNWCLQRANLDFPDNASSSAFRHWKTATDDPQLGDIVVYVEADRARADEGKGHVGLFAGFAPDGHVLTLGGNQISKTRHHMISVKALPGKDSHGGVLRLHSFRTAEGYRLS